MAIEPAYQVDTSDDEIVVRIRRSAVDEAQVTRFLDYLELASIRDRSQLTEEAAAEFADEIDRAIWEKNRHRVSRP